MTKLTERERLVETIKNIVLSENGIRYVEDLADFILADRLRILSPLINYKSPEWIQCEAEELVFVYKAIDETLKLAGQLTGVE